MKNYKYLTAYSALKKMLLTDHPYELEIDDDTFYEIFEKVYTKVLSQHFNINNKFFSTADEGIINFCFLDHYLIFCFRLANHIFINKLDLKLAEAIYYSSKIRTCTDLYYTANIGDYFIPAHSLGTVMDSRATYGKLFKIYNGVHIGPYNILGVEAEKWDHPKFGDGVTLLANSAVYGSTCIGNNVIISARSVVINENIPDNCIVIGQSPKLSVVPYNMSNFDLLKSV